MGNLLPDNYFPAVLNIYTGFRGFATMRPPRSYSCEALSVLSLLVLSMPLLPFSFITFRELTTGSPFSAIIAPSGMTNTYPTPGAI